MRIAFGALLTLLVTISWSAAAGTQEPSVASPASPAPTPTPTPSPTPKPDGGGAGQGAKKDDAKGTTDQGLTRLEPDFEPDLNLNRIVVNLKEEGALARGNPS
jgi:hypothetical protein